MKTKAREYQELKNNLRKRLVGYINYSIYKNENKKKNIAIAKTILTLFNNEELTAKEFIEQVINELQNITYSTNLLDSITEKMMNNTLFKTAKAFYDTIEYECDQYGNQERYLNINSCNSIFEKIIEDISRPSFMEEKTNLERKKDLLEEIRVIIQNKHSNRSFFSNFFSQKKPLKEDFFLKTSLDSFTYTEEAINNAFLHLKNHINNSNNYWFMKKIAFIIMESDLYPKITTMYEEKQKEVDDFNNRANDETDRKYIEVDFYRDLIKSAIDLETIGINLETEGKDKNKTNLLNNKT